MNPVPTLELDSLLNVCGSPSSPFSSSSVGTGFITECMWFPIISLSFFQCRNWIHYCQFLHWKKKREMMGNHTHSVMNPVPTLEEGEGDDGETTHIQ
jgi:hypothetical protein